MNQIDKTIEEFKAIIADTPSVETPSVWLTCEMVTRGYSAKNGDLGAMADEIVHLLDRIDVTEATVSRYADDHETVATRIEATLDRIESEARLDLAHLIAIELDHSPIPGLLATV